MRGSTGRCTVRAHANIALSKYWGKSDLALNLPAVPSISMTLSGLVTETEVRFDPSLRADSMFLDGRPASAGETRRVVAMLDQVRAAAKHEQRAEVRSVNRFPTAAGLASSASGFAALAAAATRAAGLEWDDRRVSALARQASASAARSIFGGFAELPAGKPGQAKLAARQLHGEDHWDLRIVVAETAKGPKKVGSTEGMERSRVTSPFYEAWVASAPRFSQQVKRGLRKRDLPLLGAAMEQSTLAFHACAMASPIRLAARHYGHPGLKSGAASRAWINGGSPPPAGRGLRRSRSDVSRVPRHPRLGAQPFSCLELPSPGPLGAGLPRLSGRGMLPRLSSRGANALETGPIHADQSLPRLVLNPQFVRFEAGVREPGTLPACRALAAPAGLLTRVVWTGHAARTSDLVAQVRQWASREPRAFAACSAALTETAAAFADSFERGQLAELLTLTARYHEGMRDLGEGAGAPIVEARLAEVARLATQCGGRAKPSGAGGGDVAIAFFTAAEDLAAFDDALAAAGFEALALTLGAPGPRLE
jgi:diphosphomevalonate decarboxylase